MWIQTFLLKIPGADGEKTLTGPHPDAEDVTHIPTPT